MRNQSLWSLLEIRRAKSLSCWRASQMEPNSPRTWLKMVPKEAVPAGIIIRAQEKGCIETELEIDWFKVVWVRRRGRHAGFGCNPWILDWASQNWSPGAERQPSDHTWGMASQLQVLDVVVNKPLKDNLTYINVLIYIIKTYICLIFRSTWYIVSVFGKSMCS